MMNYDILEKLIVLFKT